MVSGILGVITTISAWFISRRKAKADALAKEIYNVDKAVEIWKELALDLKSQLAEVSAKFELVTKEIAALRKENGELKKQLNNLTLELKKH